MGILKYIWNAIFGKSKKQEFFGRGGSIDEPKLKVVHKAKSIPSKIGAYDSELDKLDKYKSCAFPDEAKNFCDISTPVSFGVCNVASNFKDVQIDVFKVANLDAEYVSHIEKESSVVTFLIPKSRKEKENKKNIDPVNPEIKSKISNSKNKSNYEVTVKSATLNKEQEVIQYLLKYGSIDKRTCAEKFGLKRLDNLICELRKKGMNIKNETIELHNELGEKTKVNNYRLVTSDGAN